MNPLKKLFHAHDKDMTNYYYPNVFYSIFIRFLKPFRNKKLWVFGCWDGNRYDDNTKYFFEYVCQYHPEINAVWITRNKAIYDMLLEKGYKVCLIGTKDAKKIMKKAGCVFYTNGLYDFGKICYLSGAKIFYLCHGSGGSKIQLHGFNRHKKGTPKYYLRKAKSFIEHHLFDWKMFDHVIVPSEFCGIKKAETFCLPDTKKVAVCGFSRNDIFFDGINYKEKVDFDNELKYILYMPTFRTFENTVLNDFIDNISSDEKFVSLLKKYKYKVIIKPHNEEKYIHPSETNKDVLEVIDSSKVSTTQELLAASDILITDYSSCCTDFAVKEAPVLFYAPDIQYFSDHGGLTEYWKGLLKEYANQNIEELKTTLEKIFNGSSDGLDLTKAINYDYKGPELKNGETYCSRTFDFVIKNI